MPPTPTRRSTPLLQPARVVRYNIPRGPLPLGAFRHICTGTGDSHRANVAQRSAGAEPAGRRADAAARQPDRNAHRNTPRVQPSLPRGRRCSWPSGPASPVSETRAEALHRIASHRIASRRLVSRRRYRSAGSWPMTACRLAVGSRAYPPRCTARSAIGGGGGAGGDPRMCAANVVAVVAVEKTDVWGLPDASRGDHVERQ